MQEQAAWTSVLENVEQALAQAESETAKREQELSVILPEAENAHQTSDWPGCFERMDSRMQGLRSVAEQAGHTAAAADTVLAETEVALRQWLASVDQSAQRLANWAAP